MDFFKRIIYLDCFLGMCLLTVIAMFTPNWSNLQLIGSAITFVQVSIYKIIGGPLHVGCVGSLVPLKGV